MWRRFRKWLNIDHIVDVSVDLFLILFDVLSSPILIVMRLLRYVIGKYLMDGLRNLQAEHPLIGDVRGLGLMVATEFTDADGKQVSGISIMGYDSLYGISLVYPGRLDFY